MTEAIGLPAEVVTAPTEDGSVLDGLEPEASDAVRSAAPACRHHVGRGDGGAADAAATDAMRASLSTAPGRGTVVLGEGEKDDAAMLFNAAEWDPRHATATAA
jgi:fructose-1,6-bisphosphatase II